MLVRAICYKNSVFEKDFLFKALQGCLEGYFNFGSTLSKIFGC